MRELNHHLVAAGVVNLRQHDLAGGHGTMWDFPDSPAVQKIDAAGGVVSAMCHGPAALVNARRADGSLHRRRGRGSAVHAHHTLPAGKHAQRTRRAVPEHAQLEQQRGGRWPPHYRPEPAIRRQPGRSAVRRFVGLTVFNEDKVLIAHGYAERLLGFRVDLNRHP